MVLISHVKTTPWLHIDVKNVKHENARDTLRSKKEKFNQCEKNTDSEFNSQKCRYRNTSLVNLSKDTWSLSSFGHSPEHPRTRVIAGVRHRQYRCE